MSGSFFGGLMFAWKFTVFSESRLWECRVLQCFLRAVYGNVVFFMVFSESRLWKCRVFPDKGVGPGFSFSCRPLTLDRTLNL